MKSEVKDSRTFYESSIDRALTDDFDEKTSSQGNI